MRSGVKRSVRYYYVHVTESRLCAPLSVVGDRNA